jgi:hypothetical protein
MVALAQSANFQGFLTNFRLTAVFAKDVLHESKIVTWNHLLLRPCRQRRACMVSWRGNLFDKNQSRAELPAS